MTIKHDNRSHIDDAELNGAEIAVIGEVGGKQTKTNEWLVSLEPR